MKISLEEKLLQYKKNAKITNDAELKKALEDIIAQEELLPPDEIDHDLIFEAIGALFRLTGTTDDEIDEYADEAVQIHLEKLAEIDPRFASTDEDTEPRSKIRRINLKWLIPAAVLIALLAATLTTNAIIDLFGFSSKEYDELPNGVIYDDGSVEVEKTDDFQEFESLQSFIDSPYHEGLLIPYGYEDPFFCVVTNFGDHSETLMILDSENDRIDISIAPHDPTITIEKETVAINGFDVYLVSYDDVFQGEFVYNGNDYVITANSQEKLNEIITKLEE